MRARVTDRPRRCRCGVPIVVTVDGRELDDRAPNRGDVHFCFPEVVDLGAGDA